MVPVAPSVYDKHIKRGPVIPRGSSAVRSAKSEGSEATPSRLWKPGPGGGDKDAAIRLVFLVGQLRVWSALGLMEV